MTIAALGSRALPHPPAHGALRLDPRGDHPLRAGHGARADRRRRRGRRVHLHGRAPAARRSARCSRRPGPLLVGEDAERIEALWERLWWGCHYVGRGGLAAFAISAADIALWDLRARRRGLPLWKLLGGHDPRVKAYAGRHRPPVPARPAAAADRGEPRARLPRHQDEGRPAAPPRGRRARPRDAGAASVPTSPSWSTPTCGGRPTRPSAPRGRSRPRRVLAGGADDPRRRRGPRAHRARRRAADRRRREPAHHPRVRAPDRGRRGVLPRARRVQLRRRDRVDEGRPPGRGPQPPGDLARRPRPPRSPAGGGAERFLSRGPRLRTGSLHRPPAGDPGRRATASDRPGHGVELDWRGLEPLRVP